MDKLLALDGTRHVLSLTRQRGQGLMEFALILPLLLLLVLGIIEAGRMMVIYSSLSSGAKQAARYGSVAGDYNPTVTGEQPFYTDCQGMRETVKKTFVLQGVADNQIQITYDRSTGTITGTIGTCPVGSVAPISTIPGSFEVQDGDRVVISVTTTYRPLLPIVPLPDMNMTYAAARTIFTTIQGPTATPLPDPDLKVEKGDSKDPVAPSEAFTYAITVTNLSGSSNAHRVTVSDTLPVSLTLVTDLTTIANWTCTSSGTPVHVSCTRPAPLVPGASASLQFQVRAPNAGGIVVTNTAAVTSTKPDLDTSNDITSTTTLIIPGADLAVTKSSALIRAGIGVPFTYTVRAVNNGPNVAPASNGTRIILTDTLPTGVSLVSRTYDSSFWDGRPCDAVGNLIRCERRSNWPIGTSTLITVVVLPNSVPAGQQLINQVSIGGGGSVDALPGNNTAVVTNTVTPNVDLALSLSDSPDPVTDGMAINYTLRATNVITDPLYPNAQATGIQITVTLPSLYMQSASGSNWTCSPSSGTVGQVICDYNQPVGPGGTTNDLQLVATAPTIEGTIQASAGVVGNENDPDLSNNVRTTDTFVDGCRPDEVSPSDTRVTASPSHVEANGTAYADVTVTFYNNCGNILDPNPDPTVTLSSSRGGVDSITSPAQPVAGSQAIFQVRSSTSGISSFTAHVNGVAMNQQPSVNFYGCIVGSVAPQVGTQQVLYQFTNPSGNTATWRLTNMTLDWPQQGGRKIEAVYLESNTLWTGSTNRDPFSIPGSADWISGTEAARTITPDGVARVFQLRFNYNVSSTGPYDLTTIWDDGSGRQCTMSVTVTR